jgi:endonuclease YncB( thermonuclease family)
MGHGGINPLRQELSGDTIKLNGKSYKLDGIDSPERDQVCLDEKGERWACGTEARERLANHIGTRAVRCEDKGPDAAFPSRRIGVCTIEGETLSLNQWLVPEGMALDFHRYSKGRFKPDQDDAEQNSRGLWKGCFSDPVDLRHWRKRTATLHGASCGDHATARDTIFPDHPEMPPGCSIKGSFAWRAHLTGNSGIYHLEGCRSYQKLKAPNRWFCSEEDARAAGFRKAITCRSPRAR